MEGDWTKAILAVFGALFAIGGALSAFLQAKWLRDQRKILRGILNVLQAMRGNDIKKGERLESGDTIPDAQGLNHDASDGPRGRAVIVHEEVGNVAV